MTDEGHAAEYRALALAVVDMARELAGGQQRTSDPQRSADGSWSRLVEFPGCRTAMRVVAEPPPTPYSRLVAEWPPVGPLA